VEVPIWGCNSGGLQGSYDSIGVYIPYRMVSHPKGPGQTEWTAQEKARHYVGKGVEVLLQRDARTEHELLGNMCAPPVKRALKKYDGKTLEVPVWRALKEGLIGHLDHLEVYVPNVLLPRLPNGQMGSLADNAQTYEGKNIPMEISGKKSPDGQLIKLMGSVIAPMIPAIIDAKRGQVVSVVVKEAFDMGVEGIYKGIRVFIPNILLPPKRDGRPWRPMETRGEFVGRSLDVCLEEREWSKKAANSMMGNARTALELTSGNSTPHHDLVWS